MSDVDIDALIRGRRSRRGWLLPIVAVLVVGAGIGVFLFLQPDESVVVAEPERVEATTGQLSTTVDLSGSAVAERSADLNFEAEGTVVSVAVETGEAVKAGDTLAALDDSDAQRRIETAEVQLRLAQLRLDALLATAAASEVASARQSIESAESQVTSAEQALARLSEPPSASDLASAEQAVATALGQLSSTEETLAQLSEPPNASDLATAEQAVATALGQLSSTEETLVALLAGPSETEVASARSAVTQAQAQLAGALSGATDSWIALGEAWDEYCDEYGFLNVAAVTCAGSLPLWDKEVVEPLSDEEVEELHFSLEGRSSSYQERANRLINANVAFILADAARQTAVTALSTAEERFEDLPAPVSDEDVRQAELAVEAARASHAAAVAHLEELRAPTDESDEEQARASLDTAVANLTSAQARYEELLAGATANAVAQQEENVRLAEISLEEARAALANLTVLAPFDGVAEAVNVHPGDRVTPNAVAFSLNTPDRILIDLTVTEADLLALEVGQAGLASFDGVEGVEYPVRIVSISRMPDTAQGVVTYGVEARILAGAEIAEVAGQIAVLAGEGVATEFGRALDALTGGGDGAPGFGGGGPGGPLAGIELPEGVTIRDVVQAVINGEPLPEGVTLPEGFEIPQQILERLAAGGPGAPGRQGAEPDPVAVRLLPAPGMSAGVTLLTEVREQSVLVPVSTVRQLDGAWFVTIPGTPVDGAEAGFERVGVEVGESDGVNVEITSGLEDGAVLLIGADSAGIAFSATQQQQQPEFGFGGGFGGGPPGGFGGAPGGGGR